MLFREPVKKIDRKKADIEALKYAIALYNDRVLGVKTKALQEYPLRDVEEFNISWRTGVISYLFWINILKDKENFGKHFWHSNVRSFLNINRSSAIVYLKTMQNRHPLIINNHLENYVGWLCQTHEFGPMKHEFGPHILYAERDSASFIFF